MHRSAAAALLIVFSLVLTGRAEIIDRILAVVEGQLITLSDVRAVTRLGLEPGSEAVDPTRRVLDALIDRQLMLVEVERYAPPEPSAELVEGRLKALHARFPDMLAFVTTLHQVGMTEEHLRRYVRDALRIEAYLQQRFSAAIQPTDDEIAGYYRLHADEYTREGKLAQYADVRAAVRARFIEERRDVLVREWLAGLRRRADIVDLYVLAPGSSPAPRSPSDALPGQQLSIQRNVTGGCHGPGELRLDDPSPFLAHSIELPAAGQHPAERRRERVGTPRLDQHAVDARPHFVPQAASRRRHDRAPMRHRLERHQRAPLVESRMHEHSRRPVPRMESRIVDAPRQYDPTAYSGGFDAPLERAPERTISGQHPSPALTGTVRVECRQGVHEDVESLVLFDAACT